MSKTSSSSEVHREGFVCHDRVSCRWAPGRAIATRSAPVTLESGGAARWHFDISGHDSEDDSGDSSSAVSDSSCDLALDEAGFHIFGFYDWVLERGLGPLAS